MNISSSKVSKVSRLVRAQEVVCDFDMRSVLTALHAYLELDGAGSTICKQAALETLLNLLGTASAASVDPALNIFDGLKVRDFSVLNPVDVPGTPFSMASVDLTTQVQGGVHRDGTTRHRCLLVSYFGAAAFFSPINVNSYLQPSSPFYCSDPELVDNRLVHAPCMGAQWQRLLPRLVGLSGDTDMDNSTCMVHWCMVNVSTPPLCEEADDVPAPVPQPCAQTPVSPNKFGQLDHKRVCTSGRCPGPVCARCPCLCHFVCLWGLEWVVLVSRPTWRMASRDESHEHHHRG